MTVITKLLNTFDPRITALDKYLRNLSDSTNTAIDDLSQYREYVNGNQADVLTDEQEALLGFKPGKLNICYTVVSVIADRLKLRAVNVVAPDEGVSQQQGNPGLDTADQLTRSEQLTAIVEDTLAKNQIDQLNGDVQFNASRDGQSFTITEFDNGKGQVSITVNDLYAGNAGVYGAYDDDGRTPRYFIKRWITDLLPTGTTQGQIEYLNIYYENRIEKWKRPYTGAKSGKWQPADPDNVTAFTNEEGDIYTTTIIWWTDTLTPDGTPLGFPVFHFRANDTGGNGGRSDLADIVPDIQDEINRTQAMLSAAEQLIGTPTTYVATDAKVSTLDFFPGSIARIPKDSSVSQSQAADLNMLNASLDAKLRRAAEIANVPVSELNSTAQIMAEGTMKQKEIKFIAKIERRQTNFGSVYEAMAKMILKLLIVFDNDFTLLSAVSEVDDLQFNAEWEPAEIRNETDAVERAAALHERLGLPLEIAWRHAGLSPEDIAEAKAILKEQQNAAESDILTGMLVNIAGALNGNQAADSAGTLNAGGESTIDTSAEGAMGAVPAANGSGGSGA